MKYNYAEIRKDLAFESVNISRCIIEIKTALRFLICIAQ